jgi:plastocyanin
MCLTLSFIPDLRTPSHRTFMAKLLGRQPSQLAKVLVGGILVTGCGGDGGGNGGTPPAATAIAKASANSGDAQTGTVGQPLANPLRVVVTEDGAPSSGVTVAWLTTVPGASLAASSATDADGIASNGWTLGNVLGSQTAQATLSGATGSPVSFTATAAPGAATSLSKLSGDNQNGEIGTQLGAPVQAKVSDQFGNGVQGVEVAWAATGATVSAATVASGASGASAINVTLGGTAGPVTITATAGVLAGSPLTFNAIATTAPPPTTTISVVNNAFNPSSLTVDAGSTVTWSWSPTAQNHNVVPDGTVPTTSGNPVDGPHTYQFKFDNPGTYRYHCAIHGAPGGIGMSGIIVVQ